MLQGFNINIHLKKIERNTHTQMGNKESKEDRCSLFFLLKVKLMFDLVKRLFICRKIFLGKIA